jgi:hypothetical protein
MPHGRLNSRISTASNAVPLLRYRLTIVSIWPHCSQPAAKRIARYISIKRICATAYRASVPIVQRRTAHCRDAWATFYAPRPILSAILSAILKALCLSVSNFVAHRGDHSPQPRLRRALPVGSTWSRARRSATYLLRRPARSKREVRGGTGS